MQLCKGSLSLGSACGHCQKCLEAARAVIAAAKNIPLKNFDKKDIELFYVCMTIIIEQDGFENFLETVKGGQ